MDRSLKACLRERYAPDAVSALWAAASRRPPSERFALEVAGRWEGAAAAFLEGLRALAAVRDATAAAASAAVEAAGEATAAGPAGPASRSRRRALGQVPFGGPPEGRWLADVLFAAEPEGRRHDAASLAPVARSRRPSPAPGEPGLPLAPPTAADAAVAPGRQPVPGAAAEAESSPRASRAPAPPLVPRRRRGAAAPDRVPAAAPGMEAAPAPTRPGRPRPTRPREPVLERAPAPATPVAGPGAGLPLATLAAPRPGARDGRRSPGPFPGRELAPLFEPPPCLEPLEAAVSTAALEAALRERERRRLALREWRRKEF